jgi:alpha-D-ribose 1-methylphosphonate 5-triphosphate synthase subunit PhnL
MKAAFLSKILDTVLNWAYSANQIAIMRLKGIRASKIKPIELFEVSGLSEVVVIAGPNGVGKSRLFFCLSSNY